MTAPTYKTAEEVGKVLSPAADTLVVDVRESDRAGGHIKGSCHIPAPQIQADASRFVHLADGKKRVIFHCMYSQVRGPSCATLFQKALQSRAQAQQDQHASSGAQHNQAEVYVLAGGFNSFAKYALAGHMDMVENLDHALYSY